MSRHSPLPAITVAVCLVLSTTIFSATVFAQSAEQTTSPIDVLYFVTYDTIQTYNVDPTYSLVTLYGTLTVPAPMNSHPVFVPGANDRYIYVLCPCGTDGTVVQVYATDVNGAPQAPPIQTYKFGTALSAFLIDPNGTLAYAVQALQNSSHEPEFGIKAIVLNPETGILTPFPTFSAVEYPPSAEICGSSNPFADPYFSLAGFNLSGTQLIDDWRCSGYDDWVGYYYTRTVNQETGALGPDVPTVGSGSSEDEYSTVTFAPTSILSFTNYGFEGSANELSPYWPNAAPDFPCTYTMLDACSYSGGISTDRTGNFIFFDTYTGVTDVTRLNMASKTIEPVGVRLPGSINSLSLDDRLIYGGRTLSWNGQYVIPIYIFDPDTGSITDNHQIITEPYENTILIPALRY